MGKINKYKGNFQHRFLCWIGEWISLYDSIIHLVIVPFGYCCHRWEISYGFWMMKKGLKGD